MHSLSLSPSLLEKERVAGGIAVNLSFILVKGIKEKVSPPFEGGVAAVQ
jgi:hypothetical protein